MGKYIRLLSFLKQAKKETAVKTGISLAVVAASFAQALLLARAVTKVFDRAPSLQVILCFLACLLVLLLRAYLLRCQEGYTKKMAAKVKGLIRSAMLEKLTELGPAYQKEKRSGNLQSLITDGVESFEPFLTQYFPQTLVVFLTTLFTALYLWFLDASVGLLVLVMAGLSVIIPHLFMPAVSRVMIAYWRDYAELNAQYIDDLQGMSTLKSMGASGREKERLKNKAWAFAGESMKNLGISLTDSTIIVACTAVGTAASVALAAVHMAQGRLEYSSLLIILFLSAECMKPLNDMNTYWHSSYLGLSVASELFGLLDEPAPLKNGGRRLRLEQPLPEIEYCQVSFSYKGAEIPALKQVNLKIEAGKTTAIIGKSGSGKSTAVSLLLRFYDVDAGGILLGGRDLREYDIDYIRSQIAVVFQETYLFYGTIRDNIRMARPNADDQEIVAAAQAANAHEFITALPQGYDTLVGERGATLSGGQRQRISIARAILKDAPVLVLDEATSSVDMENEAYIQKALNRLMENKTTIIIAHRLSTIEKADRIYVLEQGQVTGSGTHRQLLEENMAYQGLVKAQHYGE